MPSTLLAVDDSVTMRKVLEITFAGTDFRVVTADGPDAALQKLASDKPDLVITDVTLSPQNGYELCKAIKQQSPSTPVLILSSKQQPFDAANGSSANADDHMDKPFDTQQMIDKVTKLLSGAGAAAGAPAPAAAAAPAAPAGVAAAAAQAKAARGKTLVYAPGGGPGAPGGPGPAPAPRAPAAARPAAAPTPMTGVPRTPAAAPQRPAPAAPPARPAPAAAPAAAPKPGAAAPKPGAAKPVAAAAAAATGANGEMANKLADMGLSPQQVDAVMALSREVVERVVWEVVPVLAETIIKEEIARLTK